MKLFHFSKILIPKEFELQKTMDLACKKRRSFHRVKFVFFFIRRLKKKYASVPDGTAKVERGIIRVRDTRSALQWRPDRRCLV